MKSLILSALFMAAIATSNAQSTNTLTLYTTNPIAANSKIGLKAEYDHGNFGYLAGYTRYYGAYPGSQANVEFRQYFPVRKWKFFYYAKAVYGTTHFDNMGAKWLGNEVIGLYYWDGEFNGPQKTYAGLAGGIGFKKEIGRFNLSWNLGYKYTRVNTIDRHSDEPVQYETFFVTGPGSIVDMNILVGIRLF